MTARWDKARQHVQCESARDLHQSAVEMGGVRPERGMGDSFFGGSPATAHAQLMTGDPEAVVEAREIVRRARVNLATHKRAWKSGPCGTRVCVPDVLAGSPSPMRRLVTQGSAAAPVRIFVSVVSSAGVPAASVRARNLCAFALGMALQQTRAVELVAVCEMQGDGAIAPTEASPGKTRASCVSVRLPLSQVNLAVAAHVLASVPLIRGVMYGVGCKLGFGGGWGTFNGSTSPQSDTYKVGLRAYLGATPQDILIPAMFLTDKLAQTDPAAWVRARLAEQSIALDLH